MKERRGSQRVPTFLETLWIVVSFPELRTVGEAQRRGRKEEFSFLHALL